MKGNIEVIILIAYNKHPEAVTTTYFNFLGGLETLQAKELCNLSRSNNSNMY